MDEYYQPTKYIVANPALNITKDFTIGEDCVYCRNDYNALGLTPLISRYCGLMTENCLTVRLSDINMRMMTFQKNQLKHSMLPLEFQVQQEVILSVIKI